MMAVDDHFDRLAVMRFDRDGHVGMMVQQPVVRLRQIGRRFTHTELGKPVLAIIKLRQQGLNFDLCYPSLTLRVVKDVNCITNRFACVQWNPHWPLGRPSLPRGANAGNLFFFLWGKRREERVTKGAPLTIHDQHLT